MQRAVVPASCRRSAVVAQPDHERLLAQPLPLESVDQGRDRVIEMSHHRGVCPPNFVINVGVPLQVLLRRLQGRVRRVPRDVHEERILLVSILEQAQGFLRVQVRRVALFLDGLAVPMPVRSAHQHVAVVGIVVKPAGQRAVGVVPTAFVREVGAPTVAEMPLAQVPSLVACLPKDLAYRGFLRRQAAAVDDGTDDPKAERGAACHDRNAGRGAERKRVVAIQPQALRGQAVDCRSLDRASVEAHVVPAEVVCHHEQDVRSGSPRRQRGGHQQRH